MVRAIRADKVLVYGDFAVEELPDEESVFVAEILTLREEVAKYERLRKVVGEVFAINEAGGPGSRKEVRDLLAPFVPAEAKVRAV